ncbi:DNA-directed RNA polymerase I subunit RPA2 [Lucilia cuprina]|uniref:DNA-directed RNA polymerase subunit beta n=1 Tax=Lucilia cuprina TaxID=7375 RepID=A0A0L0CDA1_LUCCU|nr:DNA-directed RNA polymerase I subunit RPA2 [Lucilia cuprina]KNC30197.1 DNA-directed RNA polymerase I subunit RPA2 [Lucilia cuprina]
MKLYPELTNSRPIFKVIPEELNEHLHALGAPHLDSFNELIDFGLDNVAKHIVPSAFKTPAGEKIELYVEDIRIAKPQVPMSVVDVRERNIYPTEARQLHKSYTGMCSIKVGWRADGIEKGSIDVDMGEVPIMLKSKVCNLGNKSPEQMVKHGEHDSEWGGIFIVKGNEKIIRMLLMSRRNYPIAIKRSSWKDRGANFSELGIMIRSVREDETSFNNVLHYLNNGTCKFMFSNMKFMAYVPVCLIIKCLTDATDEEIYNRLIRGYENDQYYLSCVQQMLRDVHSEGLHTSGQCREYLGQVFRSRFRELPDWTTDVEVTDFIMQQRVLVHLETNKEKFDLLVFMIQKLYQCVQGNAKIENVDSVMMQEVLTSGHLYQKYLGDRIDFWLQMAKKMVLKKLNTPDALLTSSILTTILRSMGGISRAMESFLATGNAPSRSGLGLMQSSGLVVMAENINRMRYMSHFRAVHRGSFFTTMRTTEARQLLPDAWGFICPVHTPDGTPCGLLNHLTVTCRISTIPDKRLVENIPKTLVDMGMIPIDSDLKDPASKLFVVFLEGKLLGHIRQADATKVVDNLRLLKIEGKLPEMMEIAYIPYKKKGQFPGLFLFVGPARLMRPVRNLALNKIEFIGSLEQVYMEIAVDLKEMYPGFTTHMELSKTDFMSNLANLIPMPDYNQSPRNMYQCQMGKQTMGTPCLNWPKQAANKLYRLQTPAAPLFRPVHHDNIGLDDFAMGTNAIVAVISYTGYDMEDAMIINKSAHERGFAYGSIYKSKFLELRGNSYFARSPHMPEVAKYLDNDGLPQAGTQLTHGCPFYSYYDTEESTYKLVKMDEKEDCIVDSVRFCGSYKATSPRMVCVTLRIPRPPTIGDKFASRAGQKGICSQKYPAEDLPFSETGLIPDIVFNPHGFPSRMTIAMMIETMAGKSAALHGLVHDATPFRFSEKHTAIDYFGKLLEAGGYNYYGTERLYSGVDGREMTADIFFGVVHYQRLRHMVFDKWQVRSTGPVDAITQQPIKGRKRGGGVRFGEMERDALISHGASFLLQDRLFHNSDKTHSLVCNKCGSILAPMKKIVKRSQNTGKLHSVPDTCRLCGDGSGVGYIEIPYSFKYLVTELSSVNINARFKLMEI